MSKVTQVIRSKQIPDRIELVSQTAHWQPVTWGVRHRDTNRVIPFNSKDEAANQYGSLVDEFDVEDFFGFMQAVA